MSGTPMVLAHAYGIPEALTVAVPMVVLAVIIIAGRRRDRDPEEPTDHPKGDDDVST